MDVIIDRERIDKDRRPAHTTTTRYEKKPEMNLAYRAHQHYIHSFFAIVPLLAVVLTAKLAHGLATRRDVIVPLRSCRCADTSASSDMARPCLREGMFPDVELSSSCLDRRSVMATAGAVVSCLSLSTTAVQARVRFKSDKNKDKHAC